MDLNKLWSYFLLPIYKPKTSIDKLLNDKNRLRYSSALLLIVGLLYTFTVFILYIKGFSPVVEPFLAIPEERYYYWETFFTIPIFFLNVIVFCGVSRMISEAFKGEGDFINIFSIYSIAVVLPMILTMWIPETFIALFFTASESGGSIIPSWIDIPRQIIGVLWPLVITVIGIMKSEKLNLFKSIVITIISFIPYAILTLIFIR